MLSKMKSTGYDVERAAVNRVKEDVTQQLKQGNHVREEKIKENQRKIREKEIELRKLRQLGTTVMTSKMLSKMKSTGYDAERAAVNRVIEDETQQLKQGNHVREEKIKENQRKIREKEIELKKLRQLGTTVVEENVEEVKELQRPSSLKKSRLIFSIFGLSIHLRS